MTTRLAGCVILKNDQILLIRKTDKDVWELPGGLAKDIDEEKAAVEKTHEQIGVEPTIVQQFTILEYQRDGKNAEAALFEADIESDATFTNGPGIAEIKWFALKDIPKTNVGTDVLAIMEEL